MYVGPLPWRETREGFRNAYSALRIEANYLSDCSDIAERHIARCGGSPAAWPLFDEGRSLAASLGYRTSKLCSQGLFQKALRCYGDRYVSDRLLARSETRRNGLAERSARV
jgi:hypothetical protein